MNKQGLPVSIFRDIKRSKNRKYFYCASAGPINKFFDKKDLVCMDMEGPFNPSEESPAVRIVKRQLRSGEYIHAEPLEPGNYAFGGCFIYTSDSRFSEISKYPIPLHDRQMDLER